MSNTELKWNKDLEIGIKEIDGHHKMLFSYLQTLSNEIANERTHDPKDISRLIVNAINFTENHFKSEQELMLEISYPYEDYKEHFKVHSILLAKLAELRKFEITEQNWRKVLINFSQFMTNWFLSHSPVYDVKLADFIKKDIKYTKKLKLKLKEFLKSDSI